ncbi:MAG TPA: helix-turn-helix transcriptional regulator [Castellaniella sp.]|uniref:helix-turn-helix transcriptional regulator n=1 Tax=Castellaniella sp. TaxID=1955812 RepID=UPI002F1E2D6B
MDDERNKLGQFLKDRRSKLDPETFGYPRQRRRTPGLRREEVALRAHVSVTWYTWLEQGRGGAPSAAVLGRVAQALLLTEAEREHLFLLALGRPPEVHYRVPGGIDAPLQRVLDALEYSPAVVKTATWDVVAQNRAAATLMADFLSVEPGRRNVLRAIFCDARYRAAMLHWESCARFAVATFRADVTRAGAEREAKPLVDELCLRSEEFKAIWHEQSVRSQSDGIKGLRHPVLGEIELEYSAFAVGDRPGMRLVVWNPARAVDTERIKAILAGQNIDGSSRQYTALAENLATG